MGAVKGAEKWFEEHIEVPGSEQTIPRWLKFLFNLQALADGHFKAELDKDTGEERVYWISPDRAANTYLVDRFLGKAMERREYSGPDGKPIPITDVFRSHNSDQENSETPETD